MSGYKAIREGKEGGAKSTKVENVSPKARREI